MFSTILFNELRSSAKSYNKALSSFLFFVIFIFIANFFNSENSNSVNNDIFFWLAASCAIIFSSASFLKEDYENGMIEQMIIICYNFESFIFAKIIANWINYSLPIAISAYFINQDINFLITTIISTFIINSISCFSGSFSMIGNSSPLMAVLSLPLIIPVIILASEGSLNLIILLPLAIFSFLILSYLLAKIVKISCS